MWQRSPKEHSLASHLQIARLTEDEPVEVRPVGVGHVHDLEAFRCATAGQRFTLEAEQYLRTQAVQELAQGGVDALGSWDQDRLAAVIVHTTTASLWKVVVLATAVDYRRRKQGFRLKRAVLRRAEAAGADALVSLVHCDNGPMLALNEKLGGVRDPSPDPDSPYVVCTVAVPRT